MSLQLYNVMLHTSVTKCITILHIWHYLSYAGEPPTRLPEGGKRYFERDVYFEKCMCHLILIASLFVYIGSCQQAGHTSCCINGSCLGSPPVCFCDQYCFKTDSCCEDILITCPGMQLVYDTQDVICYYVTKTISCGHTS